MKSTSNIQNNKFDDIHDIIIEKSIALIQLVEIQIAVLKNTYKWLINSW